MSGRYQVAWSIGGRRFRFSALVPAACSAKVDLPDGTREEIRAGRHDFEVSCDAIRSALGA